MDLSETIIARSDQQNADDFLGGPRTFTVESVSPGSQEQPVNVNLVEAPGKPYKPSKSMRRVMVALWGKDSQAYAGRRITLYCDPAVKFGGSAVGGIKISHLSHLDKKRTLNLTASKGKKAAHTVDPLIEAAPTPQRDWHAEAVACASEDALRALYMDAQAANASSEVLAGIQGMAANFATPQDPEPTSEPVEQ